jgi:hypothetical protein
MHRMGRVSGKVIRQRSSVILALILTLAVLQAYGQAWSFGVMGDSQWKSTDVENNPNTVAVGIIKQLNQKFIEARVKFVIQVGDLTDNGSVEGMDTRAKAAEDLYKAGIGFYPLRGNHDGSKAAATRFQVLYPQATGTGPHVFGASNFSGPPLEALQGLSYSFDYCDARFVLLDQFTRADGSRHPGGIDSNIHDQQNWITARLSSRPARVAHGFVFSHKNLIGQRHKDTLLGSDPAQNPAEQNEFFASLASNGVRYHFSGHDHIHHRSLVKSPDLSCEVMQIMSASSSFKFYKPNVPSNDQTYNFPAFGNRETPVSQEVLTVGYYIVTVDGPRVTVDYYSSPLGVDGDRLDTTPQLAFSRRERFGFSLNGRQFLIPPGASYRPVMDRFEGTTARILDGSNQDDARDHSERALAKAVNTGWTARRLTDPLSSNILSLWGMTSLGASSGDLFTLSMSLNTGEDGQPGPGIALLARNADGTWVPAVDQNRGGLKKFIQGPWAPGYGLGSYGLDLQTQTAWAVLNYDGDFAVGRSDKAPVQISESGQRAY